MKKIFLIAMDCSDTQCGHISKHTLRKVLANDAEEAKKLFLSHLKMSKKYVKDMGFEFEFCHEIDATTTIEQFGDAY